MINTNPSYIRAARALLDWTLQDLSRRCGIHWVSLQRIEAGKQKPEIDNLKAIHDALLRGGAKITDKGVEESSQSVTVFHDFLAVLDDVENTLSPGDELLQHCADERRSTPEVTARLRDFEAKGIRLRFTLREGDDFMTTSPENYRGIDPEYFATAEVMLVYADRTVLHVAGEDGDSFVLIREGRLADAMRRQFSYWWERGKACGAG